MANVVDVDVDGLVCEEAARNQVCVLDDAFISTSRFDESRSWMYCTSKSEALL